MKTDKNIKYSFTKRLQLKKKHVSRKVLGREMEDESEKTPLKKRTPQKRKHKSKSPEVRYNKK